MIIAGGILAPAAGARDRQRGKARYYFLEGLKAKAEGRPSEAYEYFKHASRIDPSFSAALSEMGEMRFSIGVDTLQTRAERINSLNMLKPFVDEFPYDYEESIMYAYTAARLDSINEAIRIYERADSLMPERTATLLRLSDIYFATGQDEKAFKALDRYETIEGKSPQLTLKKITFLINRRDTVAALAEATDLINSNPREAAYLLLKGNLFQLVNRKDSVLSYFQRAEELAPDAGSPKLSLADFYLGEGDTVAYDEKIYEALLAEDFSLEDKAGILSEYLQRLLNDNSDTGRGDYLFSELERLYPHEEILLDLSARYNAAKGDFKTAAEKIGYALDMNSAEPSYWTQKMQYLASAEDYKGVMATYREAEKHIEVSDNLKLMYAIIAQTAEEYDEALDMMAEIMREIVPGLDLSKEIDLHTIPMTTGLAELERLSSHYTSVGDIYHKKGDKESAYRSYRNALEVDPENGMAMNNYAYFLTEDTDDPESLAQAEELSRKSLAGDNKENPTFLDTYAWILYKQGKFDEALIYQRQAVDKSEQEGNVSEELYDHLGDILKATGDKEGAIEAWKKAIEVGGEDKEITKKLSKY